MVSYDNDIDNCWSLVLLVRGRPSYRIHRDSYQRLSELYDSNNLIIGDSNLVYIIKSVSASVRRKAAKATLILFPLLGLTYLLFLFPPQNAGQLAFKYINSVLQSTQVC